MNYEQKKKGKKLLKQYGAPLAVLALTAVLLLFLSFTFHYPVVGEAIGEVPEEPLDLVHAGSFNIEVSKVTEWEFTAETSEREASVYQMEVVLQDGILRYHLSYNRALLASGLLGKELPQAQGIFVDDDAIADIELRYNPDNQILAIDNLRFVAPETATIRLLKSPDGVPVEEVVALPLNKEAQLKIEVLGANSAPTATVSFDDSSATFQLQESAKTATSRKYNLKFTPTAEKPYLLKINAVVGGKTTSKSYLLAGNGFLYQLNDPQYPQMKLILLDDVKKDAKVEYTFPAVSSKQPFSLPCKGSVNIESSTSQGIIYGFGKSTILSSYDGRKPEQWKFSLPSEFSVISSFKGYFARLNATEGERKISVQCTFASELPPLKSGWNLVGITGFASLSTEDLTSVVPPGAHVRQVREVQRDEVYKSATALVPGKVYWVLVE